MPLVFVNYREIVLDRGGVKKVVDALPDLVAKELSVEPDGRLTSAEVDVWVRRQSKLDVSHHDVQIIIFASPRPEREAKVQEATEKIGASVNDLLAGTGLKSYVDIILALGGFAEFVAKR